MRYDFNIFGFRKMISNRRSNLPSLNHRPEKISRTTNKSRHASAFFLKRHALPPPTGFCRLSGHAEIHVESPVLTAL